MSSSMASNSSSCGRSNPSNEEDSQIPSKPPGSNDIGWNYGRLIKREGYNYVKCIKCNMIVKGEINRLKQHIAGVGGEVSACLLATYEERRICRENLEGIKKRKVDKRKAYYEFREEVQISVKRETTEPDFTGEHRSRASGSLNKLLDEGKWKQTTINEEERRKWKELAHDYAAMWAYTKDIPFNNFDCEEFDLFCEAVGKHGPGYKGPSQYQLRVPLLNKAYKKIEDSLEKIKEKWDEYGCSILTDRWIDRKYRSVMNLYVHCREETSFINSVEDSTNAHTGEYILNWVENCIKKVGEKRVLQVVTDNHPSNMAAKNMLKEKRPNIFWTSCATHTINLMLEGIGKIPKYKAVIEKARSITIFLYAHQSTLALMRSFTNRRELIRSGITRFATNFLSLSCLMDKKSQLATMVSSEKWDNNRWSKSENGKSTKTAIYSDSFWKDIKELLKVYTPLFKLLRIVDTDRKSSIGFVYGMLEDAKNEIKVACNREESTFRPIIDIIEKESRGRLDSTLHLTAYYLNPYYYYKDMTVQDNTLVRTAVMHCICIFYPDHDIQEQIDSHEFLRYKKKEGLMGSGMADRYRSSFNGMNNFDPAHWWDFYGDAPYLRQMAIKILSLTSSSYGCKRNFSVFEGIHTKKSRLDAKKLNDLVFVQFNKKMAQKRNAKKDGNGKDVLVAPDDSRALHWKDAFVREKENDDEVEIFSDSGLTWDLVVAASGVNEDRLRRSKMILRRRAQEGSSSAVVEDLAEHVLDRDALDEDGDDDLNEDYDDSSEEELDNNLHYEDDDEDE